MKNNPKNVHVERKNKNMGEDPFNERKICIIDDDADIREIYSLSLKHKGFKVVLAVNGAEGLEVIKKEHPDVILLDIQMPVMDGLEVLKKLEKDPELSRIPVIMLSNVDDEEVFKEVGKFDTRFYLIKALTTPQKTMDIISEVLH